MARVSNTIASLPLACRNIVQEVSTVERFDLTKYLLMIISENRVGVANITKVAICVETNRPTLEMEY